MNNKLKGYLSAFSTTFIFGFTFLFAKKALYSANNDIFSILSYRFLASCIFIFFLIKINIFEVDKHKLLSKSVYPIILIGIFNPVLTFTFETISVTLISTAELSIFIGLIPTITSLLAFFIIKEKVNTTQWICMIVAFIGIIIISYFGYSGEVSQNIGRFTMLLAVTSIGLFFVLSKKTATYFTPIEKTLVTQICGAVVFTIVSLLIHISNNTMGNYVSNFFKTDVLANTLYCGILASFLCMFLLNYATTKISASAVSFVSNFTVIVSMLVGVIFLNESLFWYHIVGILLIGSSICISTYKSS